MKTSIFIAVAVAAVTQISTPASAEGYPWLKRAPQSAAPIHVRPNLPISMKKAVLRKGHVFKRHQVRNVVNWHRHGFRKPARGHIYVEHNGEFFLVVAATLVVVAALG